jgi:hypothetical protein
VKNEAALWSRILRAAFPLGGPSPPQALRDATEALLALELGAADRARMHDLVAARWRGALSVEEEAELETYCRVSQILDVMHEEARRSLGQGGDGDTPPSVRAHEGARAEEKRRSREEDRLLLLRGEKTREDLRRENGLFAFPRVRIDLDGAEALA